MYFGKKNEFDWAFALAACDIAALTIALLTVQLLQHGISPLLPGLPLSFRLSLLCWLSLIWSLRHFKLYTWKAFNGGVRVFSRLVIAVLCAVAAVGALRLFFFRGDDRPIAVTLELIAIVASLMVGGARALFRWLAMDRLKLIVVERIAFAGWSPHIQKVIVAYQKEMGKFQVIVGFFQEEGSSGHEAACEAAREAGYRCLGSLDMIETMIERERVTMILVDGRDIKEEAIRQIVSICSRHMVNFKIIPAGFDLLATKIGIRVIAGVPVIGVQGLNFDHFNNRLMKRSVDIIGALVGLTLAAPAIAIAGFLIYRESPGPIFYRQTRLGFREKPFNMFKLRSMRLDAEKASGAKWAVQNDPRRLKIGAFLRKTNLDETPQFWNILKGDMSLVGPRPERPEFTSNFRETIANYNLRHTCRPGLTGWAAVNGLRGDTSLEDRLAYDIDYLENWSLWLDFKIMIMTLSPSKNTNAY